MSRSRESVTIEKSQLGNLEHIASGGQAMIYKLASTPHIPDAEGEYVFKKYRQSILKESSHSLASLMPQLILHPDEMTPEDQKRIRTNTVWPQALVMENGKAQGILMKLIPNQLFVDQYLPSGKTKRRPLELQLIFVHDSVKREQGIPISSEKERLILFLRILRMVDVFHRNNLVIGDFSPKNIVVTNPLKGANSLVPKFLDIDAFRLNGGVPATPQMSTPHWGLPEHIAATKRYSQLEREGASPLELSGAKVQMQVQTTKSDIFKLGILLLRLFHEAPSDNPNEAQGILHSRSAEAAIARLFKPEQVSLLLSMRDPDPNARPTASQLFTLLC